MANFWPIRATLIVGITQPAAAMMAADRTMRARRARTNDVAGIAQGCQTKVKRV